MNYETFSADTNALSVMPVLQAIIPDIRKFFKEQIRHETLLGNIPPAAVDQQELLSDFYLRIFERPEQRPDDPAAVSQWLKDEARAFILDKINSIKEKAANTSYEDLLADCVNAMEERITIDAEGELVLEEDLDDDPWRRPVPDIAA